MRVATAARAVGVLSKRVGERRRSDAGSRIDSDPLLAAACSTEDDIKAECVAVVYCVIKAMPKVAIHSTTLFAFANVRVLASTHEDLRVIAKETRRV